MMQLNYNAQMGILVALMTSSQFMHIFIHRKLYNLLSAGKKYDFCRFITGLTCLKERNYIF